MRLIQTSLAAVMLLAVVGLPTLYYRLQYSHTKRLRPVHDGVLYRCGLLTSSGFSDAIDRYRIRTVINLREEAVDPVLSDGRRESELLEKHGVRFVHIPIDLSDPRVNPPPRPQAIEAFLKIMDDPDNHPVLLHCQAGIHRTGIFTAIYRMEYQHWPLANAMDEMKDNGFQLRAAHIGNEYVRQYVIHYQPRKALSAERAASSEGRETAKPEHEWAAE